MTSTELFQTSKMRQDFETCADLLDEYFEPFSVKVSRKYQSMVSKHTPNHISDRLSKISICALCIITLLFITITGSFVLIKQNRLDSRFFQSSVTTRIGHLEIPPDEENSESHVYPKININTASVNELTTLPGIGPVLAQRIVDEREQYGYYHYAADLLSISGIGEKTLSRLLPYLIFDPNPTKNP